MMYPFNKTIPMFPPVTFECISLQQLNICLAEWGHKMGVLNLPNFGDVIYYALFHEGNPVAVAAASQIISTHVGGGLNYLTRENTIELSRLCASRPHLCRVALRLWREFVFPGTGFAAAISYQDADLHNGNTYRFDGWKRAGYSSSGTDKRGRNKGRRKHIWVWPPSAVKDEPE